MPAGTLTGVMKTRTPDPLLVVFGDA